MSTSTKKKDEYDELGGSGNGIKNLLYTGGTPTPTKLPYTGGTPTPTQYAGSAGGRYVTDVPGLPEGLTLYKANEGSGGANNTESKTGSSYSYAQSAPSYTNRYQGVMDQAANALLNRKAFTYDPANDPMYQQYADSYTRQGQKAMQDTLAQVSARTGGLASSYAGTAAQQTYNGYMSALADKVPELRQLAYQMYMDEGDTMRQNLNMLQGLEATEYGRYRDRVADNKWQQEFDTQNSQWQQKFDYEKGQDDKKWKWDEDGRTHDWNRESTQDAQKQVQEHIAAGGKVEELPQKLVTASGYSPAQWAAWEKEYADAKSLAAAQLMEGTGDYSRYAQLYGLSDEEVAALVKRDQEQNAPKVSYNGGGKEYTKTQADMALDVAMQGDHSDAVRRIVEGFYGLPLESVLAANGYVPQSESSIGGVSIEEYDAMGGNYQEVAKHLGEMKASGASAADILAAIKDAKESGVLNQTDYMRLYNQYRG